MFKISNIRLRCILNSNADMAVEADIFLNNNNWGRGSSPAAIIPGKRERNITDKQSIQKLDTMEKMLKNNLIGNEMDQQSLDAYLNTLIEQIGSDVSIAISIAFAKAAASSLKMDFVKYLFEQIQLNSYIGMPHILVPIFSGGVHSKCQTDSFQQIMICINEDAIEKAFSISKDISRITERKLEEERIAFKIADSGGYVTEYLSTSEKLVFLQEIIAQTKYDRSVAIAVDVAAEHLLYETKYFLDGTLISSKELLEMIKQFILRFRLCYIEDPFVAEDIEYWKELKDYCGKTVDVVGDDLYATQAKYIDSRLASGAVIKMNQVGTLTDTLLAIKEARKNRMTICVSHRSHETEDVTMCDLAVAVAAEYVKIGGVRRGERIIKYNQLLRLKELME